MKNLYALLIGIFFSIIIVKGEIISWFRIQEMFLFQDIHMYGVIGSAIAVGAISILLIKKFNIKDITGKPIEIKLKPKRYTANFVGGSIFGLGWALTGACPGPLYAHVGYGHTIMLVAILFAVLGVYIYGLIHTKIAH